MLIDVFRFIILRTKPETSTSHIEKMVRFIETTLTQRVTQIILRQHNQDAGNIAIQCADIHRIERVTRKMAEQGYEVGPALSQELIMHEGQVIKVRFRGNICRSGSDGEPDEHHEPMEFVYNSHIKAELKFDVTEIDKFAQKGIDCFRGFAQLFTVGLVPKEVDKNEEEKSRNTQSKKMGPKVEMVEADILLWEMLISLPKVSKNQCDSHLHFKNHLKVDSNCNLVCFSLSSRNQNLRSLLSTEHQWNLFPIVSLICLENEIWLALSHYESLCCDSLVIQLISNDFFFDWAAGLVGNDMLRHLASEIGEEWRRLAQCLSIRKVRIQAIVRNNVNNDSEQAIYDMLLTWAKKIPRSVNKVGAVTSDMWECHS